MGGGLVFAWALFFVALLGAMFFETLDWVAGAGLALAIPVAGATYEMRGGKMIEGILVAVIVLLLVFAPWRVALVVSTFLLLIIVSGKILQRANLFTPSGGAEFEREEEEEDPADQGIIVRR